MTDLAEVIVAPDGTEYRTGSADAWQTATVGFKLQNGYEIRNTQSNDYEIKLLSNAGIGYASPIQATLKGISGTVKYRDPDTDWTEVTTPGSYSLAEVGTGGNSNVSVVCSGYGSVKPPPWT